MFKKKGKGLISVLLISVFLLTMLPMPASGAAIVSLCAITSSNLTNDPDTTWTTTFTIPSALNGSTQNRITLNFTNVSIGAGTVISVLNGCTNGTATKTRVSATQITVETTETIPVNTVVMISANTITNGASGPVTVQIDTEKDDGAGYVAVDSGTTAGVALVSSGATQTIDVGQAATVSISGGNSFDYELDPINNTNKEHNNTVTVYSNNIDGYDLNVQVNQQLTESVESKTIPAISVGIGTKYDWSGGQAGTPGFGYRTSAVSGTGVQQPNTAFGGTEYAGFKATPEVIMRCDDATADAHQITVNYKAVVDWSIESGTYTNTVTYTLTPSATG